MTDNLIEVRELHKAYHKANTMIEVLKGVSFGLRARDRLAIVGQSGAGKSTLLHLMGTLDTPDQGTIFFEGQDVFAFSPDQLALFRNQSLGFVFQFHHLMPELSALENVMLPCLIHRISKQRAHDQAQAMLLRVGLKHRLSHKPSELSGGEQQRVALARALVMRPKLLLADEVTGNLDEKTAQNMHALLLEMNEEMGCTLVVVTHHKALAAHMNRQIVLEQGIVREAS